MECEIVLVVLETGEGAEDGGGARLLVDSGFDGEVKHSAHFGGAKLEEGGRCGMPRSIEVGWEDWGHCFGVV